jgi:hypothetical protein
MVKKVIDIIPPEKPQVEEAAVAGMTVMGESQAVQEPPVEIVQTKPHLTVISHEGEEKVKKPKGTGGAGKFITGLLWKFAILAAVVFTVMYVVDMRYARAVVRIWPETSVLAQDAKITIDTAAKGIDAAKNIAPGIIITADETIKGDSAVTTRKDVQGRAQGTIKIVNNYTAAQRLIKGTRFQAPLEKFKPALAKEETPWFRTTEDVTVEAKSSATVKVVADGAGEKYNIDPSVFSVPGLVGTAQYTFVYGQSFEKFGGGSVGDTPQVAQADLDAAKTDIAGQAKAQFADKLKSQVPQGFVLLEDTVKIDLDAPQISVKIGDQVAKIPVTAHGKASATAYRVADIDNFGKDFILSKVPAGSIADMKSLEVKAAYAGLEAAAGKPALTVTAKITVYQGMDDSDLKKGLSEKSFKEAEMFLQKLPGMKDAKIELAPLWRTSIPRELDRIDIQTILN